MLSSVSYVCLGVCAGIWVISRGIHLGVLVLSFISVLLFQRSPFPFAIYLRHSMTEAKTASPLESAVHSIAWFHQLGGE